MGLEDEGGQEMETESPPFRSFSLGFLFFSDSPSLFLSFWELAYGREEGKMLGERLAKRQGEWWLKREALEHV